MKTNGLIGAGRRTSVRGSEVSWMQAYEKRMREIQSGSYSGRGERPYDFDWVVSHHVVGFFK
jgi:hypothetical protein